VTVTSERRDRMNSGSVLTATANTPLLAASTCSASHAPSSPSAGALGTWATTPSPAHNDGWAPHHFRKQFFCAGNYAWPQRDVAMMQVLFGAGLRRSGLVGLDLAQLQPHTPDELRRARKARLLIGSAVNPALVCGW
jgi:hypothetical protein